MRAAVSAILAAVLAATGAATVMGSAAAADEPRVWSQQELAAVTPYRSTWPTVQHDIASLTDYTGALAQQRRQYQDWDAQLRRQWGSLQASVAASTEQLRSQRADVVALTGQLQAEQARRQAQQRVVGALARLLYQQPSPELSSVAQLLDGKDLRAFDRQNMVTSVLESKTAELQRMLAEEQRLQDALRSKREQVAQTEQHLAEATSQRDAVAAKQAIVSEALAAVAADSRKAQAVIDEIRRAEAARIAAAAAAAAAQEQARAGNAAGSAAGGTARPTGGGTPARSSADFSARLPAGIPYRSTFLTYGMRYRVEPALLAAIANQESGFDPWAGCDRTGAGKGIMQHESQSQYCGPAAVSASVERAAIMLAGYYNRSGSWTAAVFAYNNGPGLMDEWVRYSGNRTQLLSVLAAHYDASPWASPGPRAGFSTWGRWRAAVAYSYAAPDPLPGFRSATQTWLIYRQG